MTVELIFLENEAQVRWVKESLSFEPQTKLVAVTAEALQALEACDVPHEAVSKYADMRRLVPLERQFNVDGFALAREIESFIMQRYAGARFDGLGFLSGQAYYIQFSISAIATRAFLMRETIRACSPDTVTVFGQDVTLWFLGDGYARNPWLDVVETLAKEYGFRLEVLKGCALPARDPLTKHLMFLRRLYRYARRETTRLLGRLFHTQSSTGTQVDGIDDLRLLMVGSLGYDWGPVLEALRTAKGVKCYWLDWSPLDERVWTRAFDSSLNCLWSGVKHDLGTGSPRVDQAEVQTIGGLFDDWLRQRPTPPELDVLGMDLFPALAPHLRAVASLSPALARHATTVASRALELASPHAVCFFAMPWLAAKRLAYRCQQQGIPLVCYQHGGSYGTHIWIPHEQAELGYADYFLTYGVGIRPPDNPVFPVRARYVPVGSTRIVSMVTKTPLPPLGTNRVVNVLWVAGLSTHNVIGGMFSVEDTERYLLQKRCLGILGNADNLRVTYRPYRHRIQGDGTTRWLNRANLGSVRINASQPLDELIHRADIVITDTTSGTAWNEVIALRKPMILYCDPDQTRMSPHFMPDLERACHWCKSEEMLIAAVRRLADEGTAFVAELRRIDTTAFIRRYVLHRDDGQCVQRVLSFLNGVCRNGQSVDDWESSIGTPPQT